MKSIIESIIGRRGSNKNSEETWTELAPCFDSRVRTYHDINHLIYIFTMDTNKLFSKKTYTNLYNAILDTVRLFRHSRYLYPTAACSEKDHLSVLDEVNVNLNVIRNSKIADSWTCSLQRLEDQDEISPKLKQLCRKLQDYDLSKVRNIVFRYYFDDKQQPMPLELINIDIAIW